jgi:hypothetical protein
MLHLVCSSERFLLLHLPPDLSQIRDQLQIPVLALVDSDPYGLKILSVYCSGSKGMSYDSNHLTTSDIKWIGVLLLLPSPSFLSLPCSSNLISPYFLSFGSDSSL